MGRADYLKLGEWNAICDRCGSKRKAGDLKDTYDGLKVCKETCWEPRHPSEYFRQPEEDTSVPWTRPEAADSGGTVVDGASSIFVVGHAYVGDTDKTLTVGTDSPVQEWNIALTSTRAAVLSSVGASLNDSFTIYKTGGTGTLNVQIAGPTTIQAVTVDAEVVVSFNGVTWVVNSYTPLGI